MKLSDKALRRCLPVYDWDEEGRPYVVGYKRRSHKKPSELPDKPKTKPHRQPRK